MCLLNLPPLTPAHEARLETIVDGVADRGDGFAALVEHLSAWPAPETIQLDTLPLRRAVAWNEVVANPAGFRGDLVLLSGSLLQRTPLARTWDNRHFEEWFVLSGGVTVAAYVPAPASPPAHRSVVRVLARVYGTISAVTRGGEQRAWSAVVGIPMPQPADSSGSVLFIGLVVVGAAVFWLIRRHVAHRQSNVEAVLASLAQDADVEEARELSLPKDAADALEALREEHDDDA